MNEYQLIASGVKRLSDGAVIPANLQNKDWRKYLVWFNQGNTPRPDPTQSGFRKPSWNGTLWEEGETSSVAASRNERNTLRAKGRSAASGGPPLTLREITEILENAGLLVDE